MPGGKGKSIGGKGGSKDSAGKTQKSHSAKAGLQVSTSFCFYPCRLPFTWLGFFFGVSLAGGWAWLCLKRRVNFESSVYHDNTLIAQICCLRDTIASAISNVRQFPCGRVKRFLKNNTQNKMRVGAKGRFSHVISSKRSMLTV